jgi:hypothetical protein
MKRRTRRTSRGAAQVTEFGAALFLLLGCIVLPLLNMAIIPVRYGMGKSIITAEVRRLARSESFGEALAQVTAESSRWQQLHAIGGIDVKETELNMTVESVKNKHMETFRRPKSIPPSWLPEGSESPCVYLLDLKVDVDIHPLVSVSWTAVNIPGLTGPIPIRFHEVAAWENLTRDPVTGDFFVNQ